MEELQSISLRALELHGCILNEDVDQFQLFSKDTNSKALQKYT